MDYKEQWEDLKMWLKNSIRFCDQESLKYLQMDGEDLNVREIVDKSERLKQEAINFRIVLNHIKTIESVFSSIATNSIFI